jgi:hypothetical protein
MFLVLSIPTTSCSPSSSQIVKSFPKHVEVIKSNILLQENLVGAWGGNLLFSHVFLKL